MLDELRAGRKRTHWMWFVFPQFAGLGQSETARHFAIGSAVEARAYLDHPVLGPRLHECVQLVLATSGLTADAIFGVPDTLKFRSSLTLFAHVAASPDLEEALRRFYGTPDPRTLALLSHDSGEPPPSTRSIVPSD